MTTGNSRADALTDLQIMEALEAAGVKWQEQRSLANDREILTFGSTPAADIIAGIRTLLAASPASQPAAAPIDPRANRGNSVGDWLWCELMDYCKERGMPPANHDRLFDLVKRARTAWDSQHAPSPADERAGWQTGVPPVKEGSYAGFIVACRRKHNGEVYVFEANYANQYAEELRDDDGEEFTAHGWYDVAQDIHGEYSSVFSKTCSECDEIIGWQPLPKWGDESARASSANETGSEGGADARRMRTLCRLLDAMDDMGNGFPGEVHAAFQDGGKRTRAALDAAAIPEDGAPAQAAEPVAIPERESGVWPTNDMNRAGLKALAEFHHSRGDTVDAVFLAMSAAAPQPPAQADAREEAYVAKRLSETLASVYATIIGDDQVDENDGLNAIQRCERAAQVLRLEVELYRGQADALVGLTDEQRESVDHAATWLDRSEDLQNKAHAKRLRALLQGANQ